MGARLVVLTAADYKAFIATNEHTNFLQSPEIAKRRSLSGWSYEYWGLVRDNVLVGAGAFHFFPIGLGYYRAECQQGPLLDYSNSKQLFTFLRLIKAQMKKRHVAELRINPPIPLRTYTADAKSNVKNARGMRIMQTFSVTGYQHLPNKIADRNPNLLRWYFIKDLHTIPHTTPPISTYDKNAKWSCKKAIGAGVEIRTIDNSSDLETFYHLLKQSAEHHHYELRSIEYFKSIFDTFDRNTAIFSLSYITKETYRHNLKATIIRCQDECNALKKKPNSDGARRELTQRIDGYRKSLKESRELFKQSSTLPLACGLFISYGNEMVYLAGGSDSQYRRFNGAYALQLWAQQYAIDHQLARYNFYGTHGSYSGHPEQNSVWEFKRGFGGILYEQIGYFYAYQPIIRVLCFMYRGGRTAAVKLHLTP